MPDHKYMEEALISIADYITESEKNAKESDETWAAGFKIVEAKLNTLHKFFTEDEVNAILTNREEIRKILVNVGLINRQSNES